MRISNKFKRIQEDSVGFNKIQDDSVGFSEIQDMSKGSRRFSEECTLTLWRFLEEIPDDSARFNGFKTIQCDSRGFNVFQEDSMRF